MAKQKGRQLLIKIGDGATTEVFSVLCGLTTKTLTINNEEYDVTTADCTTPEGALWTEVQGGLKRVSVAGNGFFEDSTAELRANTIAMSADPICKLQIVVPAFGTFAGSFFMSSMEYGGETTGGVTYSLAFASTGAVTFTALP